MQTKAELGRCLQQTMEHESARHRNGKAAYEHPHEAEDRADRHEEGAESDGLRGAHSDFLNQICVHEQASWQHAYINRAVGRRTRMKQTMASVTPTTSGNAAKVSSEASSCSPLKKYAVGS